MESPISPAGNLTAPSGPATSRLESLPNELLREVVEKVAAFGPRKLGWSRKSAVDLKNLSLASHRLRDQCSPVLFRELVLDSDEHGISEPWELELFADNGSYIPSQVRAEVKKDIEKLGKKHAQLISELLADAFRECIR